MKNIGFYFFIQKLKFFIKCTIFAFRKLWNYGLFLGQYDIKDININESTL